MGHFNTNGGGGLLHARAIFRAAKVLEWVATWLVARHFGEQARECDELDRMCAKDQDDWADNEASEIVKIVLAYDTSGVKPLPTPIRSPMSPYRHSARTEEKPMSSRLYEAFLTTSLYVMGTIGAVYAFRDCGRPEPQVCQGDPCRDEAHPVNDEAVTCSHPSHSMHIADGETSYLSDDRILCLCSPTLEP